LSIVLGLIGAVLGSAMLQAHGRSTAGISTAHYGCLLAGIVYWFASVESSSNPPTFEHVPRRSRSARDGLSRPSNWLPIE
jgi:hypothetical protein